MRKSLLLMLLPGLVFTACKPTERKVPHPKTKVEQTSTPAADTTPAKETPATPADTKPADATPSDAKPADSRPGSETETATPAAAETFSDCLLEVNSVIQGFSILRPWEKETPSRSTQSAVYLGDGRVLVCNVPLRAATYVELRLPDGSRTVPARVIKYDADLNMGLLTVAHEEDSSIFDSRKAYPVGDPLKLGDSAEIWCLINNTMPTKIALHAESGTASSFAPRIRLKAARAIPGDVFANGAPIIREGKLVGVSQGYDASTQILSCINAEVIQRFLDEDAAAAAAGAPVLGMSLELLSDPVFRRYLRLEDSQTGLYVSEVKPMGAAEAAGIKKGDVVTAIEGMPVDSQGRCNHPVYGPLPASCVATSLKPLGQTIRVTISRAGEIKEVEVPLNRAAKDNDIIGTDKRGVQPRYIMWGGVLFQPVTAEYLGALRSSQVGMPVNLLELERKEDELRAKGVTELVALSGTIPTPATLGYEFIGGCVVEQVNGKDIHNFSEFEEALDAPTKDGIVEIAINRAPYKIYIDTQMAEAANDALRRGGIHHLRHTGVTKDGSK